MSSKIKHVIQSVVVGMLLSLAFIPQGGAQTSPPSSPPQSGTEKVAPQKINPTAQSLKEATLLEALTPEKPIAGRVSIPNQAAGNLMQAGREWRVFNREKLPVIGAVAVLGMLAVLALFYAIRGKIKIASGASAQRILRFTAVERLVHWVTALSFLTLALTGANVTFGRALLLPVFGAEAFASFSAFAKLIHNSVGFAFMVGVFFTLVIWVKDNIPNGQDVKWFLAGGGLIGKGHAPAKRFNGGQKIVFWSVVLGGAVMCGTGWHLLFPAQSLISDLQNDAIVHGTLAFLMLALILAHIYIGSVGMEGAIDAMGSGEVDLNWAKEHHSIWVKEEQERKGTSRISGAARPAE